MLGVGHMLLEVHDVFDDPKQLHPVRLFGK